MAVAVDTVVEEAMDTTTEAVVIMEVMVEDVSVDTMLVVGGGSYSSGRVGGGYTGGGYGGGSDGYRSGGGGGYVGCGVRREGSYSGGIESEK
ncbi:glycine-rich RNA-binding, abscisic acid-inducible protein-like [Brassica napus]|uniref:glycine-rich RNA-binding, abscisic acid-inducible protein-like n=1 Tax=Brassica napus TaxID=3708 RepID=UPI0006AABC89|nr:glycine-rich RNA-binding, abscisic acid-inducible protein-like [Brassica napus]